MTTRCLVGGGVVPRSDVQGEGVGLRSDVQMGVPYYVTYPMMQVMLPTHPPSREQTDACENITFNKLRLLEVTVRN